MILQRMWITGIAVLALGAAPPALAAPHPTGAAHRGVDETSQRPDESPVQAIMARLFGSGQFGKSYALVIGIGDYDSVPKLDAPGNDARQVRDFLVKEAGFDRVVLLTDERATQERIARLMEKDFPDLVKQNDRFLFYFSGHGATRTVGPGDSKKGYLLLKNSHKDYWNEMIAMEQVHDWAENLGSARHVLFVLDACFSGLAAYQAKGVDARPATLQRLSRPSSYLLTAGVDQEESYAFNGSSLFTQAFLAAVRGQLEPPPDGILSLDGLIDRVHRDLDAKSQQLGGRIRMTPQLYRERLENNEGEFFFVLPEHSQPLEEPTLPMRNGRAKGGDVSPPAASPAPSAEVVLR